MPTVTRSVDVSTILEMTSPFEIFWPTVNVAVTPSCPASPACSTPARPFHPHDREEHLNPGDCVPVEIEIWPSSTRCFPGETLRLVIAGHDIYPKEEGAMLPFALHENVRNTGVHILRTGGGHDARLRLPVIQPMEPIP